MLKIEVVYALPEQSYLIECQVDEHCTVEQAIQQSGLLAQCQLDLTKQKVGIYGKFVPLEHVVNNGDRIEIYRPLLADPKEIRRRRAEERK